MQIQISCLQNRIPGLKHLSFLVCLSKAKTWFGRPGFVVNSRGLDRSLNSCPPKVDGQPDISLGFKNLVTDLPITNLKQSLKVQLAGDFKHYLDISHPEIWGRGTNLSEHILTFMFFQISGQCSPLRRFCHLSKKGGDLMLHLDGHFVVGISWRTIWI